MKGDWVPMQKDWVPMQGQTLRYIEAAHCLKKIVRKAKSKDSAVKFSKIGDVDQLKFIWCSLN